jgi:hypothetical protein
MIVEDLTTPLSPIGRSSDTRLAKKLQTYSTHKNRVFHPTTRQYTIFSAAHGTYSKMDPILGHKANLNKFKKIEINPCIT